MPTTPGLTINDQEIWNRVMAAFSGSQSEYLKWLREALRNEVITRELGEMRREHDMEQSTRAAEIQKMIDTAT